MYRFFLYPWVYQLGFLKLGFLKLGFSARALPLCQGCVQYSSIPTWGTELLKQLWVMEVFSVGAFPSLSKTPAVKECDVLLACEILLECEIFLACGAVLATAGVKQEPEVPLVLLAAPDGQRALER